MPKNYIIIVAGGTGKRMKSDLPKQFIQLNGKEIILHTIEQFLRFDNQIKIIISVHKDHKELLLTILKNHSINDVHVVEGGSTRFHSVKNGLDLVSDTNAIVGIHDAARPLVSIETIRRCYETAKIKRNAIPSLAIAESIREINNEGNKRVDRNHFKIIQTPQCFIASDIKDAFLLPYSEAFTDDASVLEANGGKINLVEGNIENIKITHPNDLVIAKALMNADK